MDQSKFFKSRSGFWGATLIALVLGASGPLGCAGDEGGDMLCADGARCARDGGSGRDVVTPRATDLVSLEIAPQSPTIECVDGARPTVTFTATARQRDGRTRVLAADVVRFRSDVPALGALDERTGVFTPAGVGGTTMVSAQTFDGSGLTATTTLTVNLRRTTLGMGVTPAMVDMLERAPRVGDATTGPRVDYPLAGAVMPANVFPPDVMWTPRHPSPAATDLYRIVLARPHATVTAYFTAGGGFTHHWAMAENEFRPLAQTDFGQDISVTVSVLTAMGRRDGAASPFRTVDGVIAGAVYYWSPPASRLRRIDVDTARRVDFLPNPGDNCIGCHSVSRSGQRLAGFLENSSETLAAYDLTRDLTANPAPSLFRVRYTVRRCTSWSGDGTRLVSGDCGANPTSQRFSIIDTATGMEIPALAGLAGDGFDPEWSPDSRSIAFTNRMNNLALTPVSGATFGMTSVIHMASTTPGGGVDWHPTWSPDSQWLAFQHGQTRRTGVATDGLTGTNGALYLTAPRAGATPVRLDRANGGPNGNDNYRPVFSPFNSGGYYWLLFTSNRDYGNATAGVRNTKQIWVTAVRNRPDGTTDPSEVPYYLAGQETATALSPYWAPPPCRPNGESCNMGADCCSGECDLDTPGGRCVPRRGMCTMRSGTCSTNADCCSGLVCTEAHICDTPIPG